MSRTQQHPPHVQFGTFLKLQRHRWGIKQRDVMQHLPGWTAGTYSRMENGEIYPTFDYLLSIYTALHLAGVQWTAAERHEFLALARQRIQEKRTHYDKHSDAEWTQLRYQLASADLLPEEPSATPTKRWMPPRPLLAETRHLLGRVDWCANVLAAIQQTPPKKLLVLRGPVGIGKSSELHRLIQHFLRVEKPIYHVLWVPLHPVERGGSPESALDVLLGAVLAESGLPASPSPASLSQRVARVLATFEHSERPLVLLVDNAEVMLNAEGQLAPCWDEFFLLFLRQEHRASLVLASREWPGWVGRDRHWVSEFPVPPLTTHESLRLLQRLGLEEVPVEHLREVSTRVGGNPLCLEWVASLVQDSLVADDWHSFEIEEQLAEQDTGAAQGNGVTQRLVHLLEEPSLLRGHLATRLHPLLQRVIEQRLSAEARQVLKQLAVATLPLGGPALKRLCERPRLLKELRDASLLVTYPSRAQVLPMVAETILYHLTPEQIQELEERLIEALKCWLDEGEMGMHEAGNLVTELTVLYLKHHRLLDAAQLLMRYGWLGFNQGFGPRLAHLAEHTIEVSDQYTVQEDRCGSILLYYLLCPFLGKATDAKKRAADYQSILDAVLVEKVALQPEIEVNVTYQLITYAISELRFEEAQTIFEACQRRLSSYLPSNVNLQASLLEKSGWLFGRWAEYAEEQKERERAKELQDQTISIYRKNISLLSACEERSSLKSGSLKKRLARAFNNLGYYLNRIGKYEEALQAIECCIDLKEQGYVEVDTLADAYGEKSQILANLGRFQEAVYFDEKALQTVCLLADKGHTFSQEEVSIYHVNRGRLYIRLGKIDAAEQLLREALPHIHPRRRMYRMFAKDALEEIEQWRLQATSSQHQLDWRWVTRYRELAAFDSFWWLTPTGPFNEEEQRQWDELYVPNIDDAIKEHLGLFLAQSREREFMAALTEQRQPHLHYPALAIEEVRRHITDLLQLDADVMQEEPNAIVRRLYHDTIEEELDFLYLIEATYEGNSEKFWNHNVRLNPVPTEAEMQYTFSRVRHIILQGLLRPETVEASEHIAQFLREQVGLSLDLSYTEQEKQELQNNVPLTSPHAGCMVSAQTAKRFFETVLHESGYQEWQVNIDQNAGAPRVEQGLRYLYLPDGKISIRQIRDYLSHELGGHAARCIAGEHSLLGLLGIHTKNSLETEEGLATYYDIEAARCQGVTHDETAIWFGTLATGLASGVITPPQTFLSLFTFFEMFIMLYRLLRRPDQDIQTAQKQSRRIALARCLRTYRGVPDLERAGMCYTKDAHYLRGLWKIEQAIREDETILERLGVGVVALERLPDLQELGIVTSPQLLRKLVQDPDLDNYILSFAEQAE